MSGQDALDAALEEIENRIHERLSTSEIAGCVFFSKYYYQRVFREAVGESIMEYVKKRKLSLAGRELLESRETVLEIALRYGYDSHEGFTRSFKAYMGVTPAEYRKYSLSSIHQERFERGTVVMSNLYSKNAESLLRGLNEWVAQARQTAEFAVKNGVAKYAPCWKVAAQRVEELAGEVQAALARISRIPEEPDQISLRFSVIKLLEDTAFHCNVMTLHVSLLVSRGSWEDREKQEPICARFAALAKSCAVQSGMACQILDELAVLIFEDMKKSAREKAKEVAQTGRAILKKMDGAPVLFGEVSAIIDEIEMLSWEKLTENTFEEYHVRLEILSFAARMDTARGEISMDSLNGLLEFAKKTKEAMAFFSELVLPSAKKPTAGREKIWLDIAFQQNILYFYSKGEVSDEKAGKILSGEQRFAFEGILRKINASIHMALENAERSHTTGERDEKALATQGNAVLEIADGLLAESGKMGEKGGAIAFLAGEYHRLAEAVLRRGQS